MKLIEAKWLSATGVKSKKSWILKRKVCYNVRAYA